MKYRLKSLCLLCALFLLGLGMPSIAPAQDKPVDVIVVGSGLAGLITAYELEQGGLKVQVLESLDRTGGRVATARYGDGLHGEYGMHEVWADNPLVEYTKRLNIPLSKPEEPYSSVVMDGKLYPYVQDNAEAYLSSLFSPQEMAPFKGWVEKCRAEYADLKSNGVKGKAGRLQDITFQEWVSEFSLPPRVEEFIRLSVECEVATNWTDISAVYGIQQCGTFILDTKCRHAKDGNGRIIEALAHTLKSPVTLGARVTRVVRRRNQDGSIDCTVEYLKENQLHTLKSSRVVITVPYHLLHTIQMEPGLTDTQWKAVSGLGAGRYVVVHLILDRAVDQLFKVNGKLPFPVLTRGRLGVVYGVVGDPSPEQKEEAFALLIHGDYADFYLEPQDAIRARLLGDLEKIWPGFSKYVKAAYFYNYHPVATPGWPKGRSNLDALSEALREPNLGLYLAGDYIFSSHAEGAVLSGQSVAGRILEEMKGKSAPRP